MDIKKYIYSHCVSPVRVQIWDSCSCQYVCREVPCGKCLHCRNTHINEWVTRLIAQKKYSKFCYFVSLDYKSFDLTNQDAALLARETAACYHNININGKYGMHPLVLCKNHLQDFFKRFRRNTGIKIQYFACGEYGTHAQGRGFGRPHFHCIIFSNEKIDCKSFIDAWTINGYVIGRVDISDLSASALSDNNNIKTFKYVCKYLQKSGFEFESLRTIDFHRAYFKSLYQAIVQTDLFSTTFVDELSAKDETKAWCEYTKLYSPFIVCSRRPAIGAQYFVDNLERFKKQDFRLFGLPKECVTFPRYYVRRTKEALFVFDSIGEISQKPTTSSRMGYISKILLEIYSSRVAVENWCETSSPNWRVCSKGGVRCLEYNDNFIPIKSLNFYDHVNKYFFQFDGFTYNVWAKLKDSTYILLDNMDIIDVIKEVSPRWDRYSREYLIPNEQNRILREIDLRDTISSLFPNVDSFDVRDKFNDLVSSLYQSELDGLYKKKLLMQNSKISL